MLAGLTNNYLENTLSEAAITYSGVSVNEQYHAAAATRTLLKEENNFLMPPASVTLQEIRPAVNQAVLGTDIKVGFPHCCTVDVAAVSLGCVDQSMCVWGSQEPLRLNMAWHDSIVQRQVCRAGLVCSAILSVQRMLQADTSCVQKAHLCAG